MNNRYVSRVAYEKINGIFNLNELSEIEGGK